LCRGFNLGARAEASKTAFLTALEEDAVDRMERGGHTVLIVDEAQVAPDEILEEVRLLTNMEVPGGRSPLLSILLVGQPEFGERLSSVALQNLKQRVALRCELRPLTLQETAGFIASRIRAAGGIPVNVFSREAVQMIHDVSSGIPRMICVLCDNALINGLAANERPVGSSRVAEVCRDFHLAFVTSSHDPPSRTAARVLVPQPDDEGRERPARAETASVAPATSPEAATSDRPLFGSFGRHRRTGSFRGAS
jgi:general secretion pathway protein A